MELHKAAQIRIIIAIICGPNILKNTSSKATIKDAKIVAEQIYNSVAADGTFRIPGDISS